MCGRLWERCVEKIVNITKNIYQMQFSGDKHYKIFKNRDKTVGNEITNYVIISLLIDECQGLKICINSSIYGYITLEINHKVILFFLSSNIYYHKQST